MIGWFGDGNGYVGNLALKPESADTVSAAAQFRGKGDHSWSVKIAPYYTHSDDYIDAIKLADFTTMMGMPTGFVQLQFANQEAEIYGLDLSGSVALSNRPDTGSLTLKGSASYIHGQNLTLGTPLYHMMPLNGRLSLDHKLGPWDSTLELVGVARKDRPNGLRHEPQSAGYVLVNLRTGYAWGNVRLDLEARNLLDKANEPSLGGVSIADFKAHGMISPVRGAGRSINLALGVRF
jgi:iron complex outermembrane receptor protein